ncbi:MAG: DEAD/DEAH box helicase family protein [Anaerolineaceae bacterium]|nr:DEAD/DEAH box helicase family protein [Anaerolineaceae bacterium]
MQSMVALDLETTGLSQESDSIIEIGAVRFNGSRVEAEWSTLINPNRAIPQFITQLTGITNEMVRNAPPIRAVLDDFAEFVGDLPILGHNVQFDLSFLQKYQLFSINEVLDTYELASVLLPSASRYNLNALGQQLGILLPATHRALDDARVTHAVFLRLYEKALGLPPSLVEEILRLSEPLNWGGFWVFDHASREQIRNPDAHLRKLNLVPKVKEDQKLGPPLSPVEPPLPLDVEEAASLLEFGGPFSRYFESYEHRPQQVDMLRAVGNAFSTSQHLMVEAGTGTGKSLAYLVPAGLWAIQNQHRVVISTNTINLQDQLINKDIPDMKAALGLDLRAALLKGRSNYLCPRKLDKLRQRGPQTPEEMRLVAKVMVWLWEGGSGDRTEINLNGPVERDLWLRLSAEDEGCKPEACLGRMEGTCPFFLAHQTAQNAHLIIVNHALLLADIAAGSRILPDYNYLIVDEAHHLEEATTNALSFHVTQGDITRLLRELGGTSSGVLGRLLLEVKAVANPSDFALFHQAVQRATDLAFRLEHDFKQFFLGVQEFLLDQREGQAISGYGQQERILPATRTTPSWEQVEIVWDGAGETLKYLLNLLSQIYKTIGDMGDSIPEQLEDVHANLGTSYRRFSEIEASISALVSKPSNEYVYWIEIQPNSSYLALQIAPLQIGPLMEEFLWHEKASIVLTSATLTTNDRFDYLRERLYADEADEYVVGSPFDYESSALLYLINDIPEPGDSQNFQRSVENTLIKLSKATGGRLLALFTSYAQLRRTSQTISPVLADAGIMVYEQGEGASSNALLETFRMADQAILLGTRAFWEGVDIPGDALSILTIVKLPFDVPSDPIVAARSEMFEDPFNEYHLPEAILRFRQGFGRLIRTQYDRGVVVILDKRILSKRYGKFFLQSLPTCSVRIASMHDLPATAARWLNL